MHTKAQSAWAHARGELEAMRSTFRSRSFSFWRLSSSIRSASFCCSGCNLTSASRRTCTIRFVRSVNEKIEIASITVPFRLWSSSHSAFLFLLNCFVAFVQSPGPFSRLYPAQIAASFADDRVHLYLGYNGILLVVTGASSDLIHLPLRDGATILGNNRLFLASAWFRTDEPRH
jgi:hypothetical protein